MPGNFTDHLHFFPARGNMAGMKGAQPHIARSTNHTGTPIHTHICTEQLPWPVPMTQRENGWMRDGHLKLLMF